MCTVPPEPPPPPPPPIFSVKSNSPTTSPTKYASESPTENLGCNYSDVCTWTDDLELREACAKYNICLQKPPYRYKYKHFESRLQVGPTCGLVALSMLINEEVTPDEMLNIAKLEGYSNNGEMFSCKNMLKLAERVISLAEVVNVKYNLLKGELFNKVIIERLLDGAVLLVPYDADCNHSPCLRQGHTAHWALVCGVVIVDDSGDSYEDPDNVYVLCKHGKSKYLAVWSLSQLDKSNKNLREFSPKKSEDGLIYILPEGGIGGESGLREQFLIFEGL